MPDPGEVPVSWFEERRTEKNKTYFSFLSDFRGHNATALRVGESSALAFIFLLALVGNIWGIWLLVRRRCRLRAANCLVLNLFCADLLFITAMPFIAVVRWTESWLLGDTVCHMLFYLVGLSGTVIILSLSAVSLERLVSIARLRQAALRRPKALAAALLLIWALAAVATLPLCCFFCVVRLPAAAGQEMQICTLVWPSIGGEIAWDLTFTIVFFLVPGLLIIISYSKILQITKASRRSLNAGLAYSESHRVRVSQQDYKLFRALFVLMISFFIMWSPIMITILLILVQSNTEDFKISPSVFFWIILFTFANSALNPILYNIAHFRRKCQEIFLCCTRSPAGHGAGIDSTARRSNQEQPPLFFITR
ncbi:PREDICTED: free fatty acid receptor 4 isoform X1 [Calidris pugnax]|uniref:free fatty acid receptor 4 isoform X1 n=1 Tax=Calidris pugnax TaxID=198806 RepID=UPI00071C40AC|nr:PREDICTED: free fatty acid receptor 4 isoform X1 [Calidris pugnax]